MMNNGLSFKGKKIERFEQIYLFPEIFTTPGSECRDEVTDKPSGAISAYRKRVKGFQNLDLMTNLLSRKDFDSIRIPAVKDLVPKSLVAFSKASRRVLTEAIVHFYQPDFIIERFWKMPRRYLPMLKRARAVIVPDFSVEYMFPKELNRWNIFRMKASAYIMRENGITVIPNIPVCSEQYYDDVFGCLEEGGIYAISTLRAMGNYFSRHALYKFLREVVIRLNPQALIVYGNRVTIDGTNVFYFENENIYILRYGKGKQD